MNVYPHRIRRRTLSAVAALALSVGSLGAVQAATQTISINPSQVGATLGAFDGGGSCPMVTGYDVWHFVAPGGATFQSIDVTFSGATKRRTVIGGDGYSAKHAWVYTVHGADPSAASIASGDAVIDGSGSQFVLSHTCIGEGVPSTIGTSLVTQASTSVATPVEGDNSTATDVATVTADSGSVDPTGTIEFSYCVSQVATPVWGECTAVAIRSENLMSGADPADGIATATLADWPIPGAGYYVFHAEYAGDDNYSASSDASGPSETFRMVLPDNQPVIRYADMPRWIETGASARKCPSAAVGGTRVGTVSVAGVDVPLKSASYRKGGVFHPPASAKIATISRRHQPLNSALGTTFIAWHVRWNKGCNGTLNVLNSKDPGYTFTTTDADGQVRSWTVRDNFLVKKGHYRQSWFTINGPRQLVLITCADLRGGKFRKNRVIIATPTDPA